MQAAGGTDRLDPVGFQILGDRALATVRFEDDVAKSAGALFARPLVQLVEEAARLWASAGRGDGADDAAGCCDPGEQAEARSGEVLRHVGDLQRIAQIGLVGAVFQQRRIIGNARECTLRHHPAAAKLLEDASNNRFEGREDVLLRHKAHLEIELVELAGGPVGAARLVPETGRDLEVAVEPGDHGQLLELLRRLRQRVELPWVNARRHQEVTSAFGRRCGEDRGLELGEPGGDHLTPQISDHPGP